MHYCNLIAMIVGYTTIGIIAALVGMYLYYLFFLGESEGTWDADRDRHMKSCGKSTCMYCKGKDAQG